MDILLRSITGNVKKKINMRDEEGVTAMHYAARYNQYEIVKILQSYGAGNKLQPVQDHQNHTSIKLFQKCNAIIHNDSKM